MGYACPVCETPQADARHLANHLAFTAMVRGGDHGEWLDEHLPGWGEAGEAELAERVVEFAEEEDYPQLFEDTVHPDGEHQHDDERSGRLFEEGASHGREGAGHDHAHGSAHDDAIPYETNRPPQRPRDEETKAIYEEARELTEAMLADDGDDSETDDTETDAGDEE
ncbi:DUF5810 domain-containing protein [Halomarina oriensis]|uniref:Uncharacterized protein n=1 Tax=Halomarina oriensis TaxID=671145 RepID=A0A6B0GVN8_9EURY|nr:DUF5810 domain-containing protein [Halomarina oriensis]MWG36653.1 hypothetical protein [Halomarina oriensis]